MKLFERPTVNSAPSTEADTLSEPDHEI